MSHQLRYAVNCSILFTELPRPRGPHDPVELPPGPWLVTPDEVSDVSALALELWVDSDVRQSGTTAQMAYGVGDLLAYLSTLMTLEPGDLVLTGTPGGVAVGRPEPKPFLRAGPVVEAEVKGLGRQRTDVVEMTIRPAEGARP